VLLETRSWGPPTGDTVVCVHGITQHGVVFEPLGQRLAATGRRVVAVDLRGHGGSGYEPPWSTDAHVDDLLETVAALGVERAAWIGHSFGGRIVAALAARSPERVDRLALLDPGIGVPPERALRAAEIDRLDWSFATVEGALNALLGSEAIVAAPEETVAAYVKTATARGADGRIRFRYCPSAVVTAWSEMTLPAPAIAQLPTLLVRPVVPLVAPQAQDRRYRDELGSLLTLAAVPNGHNVLWESPVETEAAIDSFLARPASVEGAV
jgi:lipase